MGGYYGMYVDSFESQEAWLCCVIFAAYTTLLNQLLINKLSKSAKHLNSTVTHCTQLDEAAQELFRKDRFDVDALDLYSDFSEEEESESDSDDSDSESEEEKPWTRSHKPKKETNHFRRQGHHPYGSDESDKEETGDEEGIYDRKSTSKIKTKVDKSSQSGRSHKTPAVTTRLAIKVRTLHTPAESRRITQELEAEGKRAAQLDAIDALVKDLSGMQVSNSMYVVKLMRLRELVPEMVKPISEHVSQRSRERRPSFSARNRPATPGAQNVGSSQFCTNYATGSNATPLVQMIPGCLGCGNLTHRVNDCPTLHEKLAKGELSRPNGRWAFASGEPIPKRSGETILAAYDRVQGSSGPASAVGLMSYEGYNSDDDQYKSDDEWEASRTKQCAGYHAYHGGTANADANEEPAMVWPVRANRAGQPMAAAARNQASERVTRSGGGGFRIGFPNPSHHIKDAGASQK
jgi:hypothetical protein